MRLKDTTIPKRTTNALAKRHIDTVEDLARFVPRKYRDYRRILPIEQAVPGTYNAVCGKIISYQRKRREAVNRDYLTITMEQDNGVKFRVIYFANAVFYEKKCFSLIMKDVVVAGKIISDMYGFSIVSPEVFKLLENFVPGIRCIYSKIKGVQEDNLKRLVRGAVIVQKEPLEPEVLNRDGVPDYKTSLNWLHSPKGPEDISAGRKRLLYNDLLYFTLLLLTGQDGSRESRCLFTKSDLLKQFINGLPFALTGGQTDCINSIIQTAKEGKRCNALIQGDVGCGKTIVAVCAMVCAAENGYQSILMAPRTVLAKQHYEEIKKYAEQAGKKVVFLYSGMSAKEKKNALAMISGGDVDFIVGTHSCLSEQVVFHSLGLIITDEEHLFGVEQKEALAKKAEEGVHSISMSATPIPRTIASVLYGDNKSILLIKEKPAGRKDIITKHVKKREDVFSFMLSEIRNGRQCYVVCPAIEDSENNTLISIEAVEKVYRKYFQKYGVTAVSVNGRMKKEETEKVIGSFLENKSQILISTTVIEVGVNVPNATVMVIEQADRFGLASLHQLRGRVGRSDIQSYCFLVSEEAENDRLRIMTQTNDGFEIAEADLEQRGSGNLIGKEQSGANKYVDLMLRYPKQYQFIRETAVFCLKNGYGKRLVDMYKEHERCEEE